MADDDLQDGAGPHPRSETEPLAPWQRVLSLCGGVAALAIGAIAVFKSSNQAGSVALLAVGGGLILMAAAGSPIRQLRLGNVEASLPEGKRKQITREARREAEYAPELAQRTLDVLKQLDPSVENDPAFSDVEDFIYEREVVAALKRISPAAVAVERSDSAKRGEFDYSIDDVLVMTVRARRVKTSTTILLPRFALRFYKDAGVSVVPMLCVTNARLVKAFRDGEQAGKEKYGDHGQTVRWRDDQDDSALSAAVRTLLPELEPNAGKV